MAYVPPSERDARPRQTEVPQPGWMDEYEGYKLPQAVPLWRHATSVREDTAGQRDRGIRRDGPSPSISATYSRQLSSQNVPQSHGRYARRLVAPSTPQPYQCPPLDDGDAAAAAG
ncbi:hypothetical protein AAFF_G00249470 [Aldrovandia affinis]|uniref:Uncharacterized protein n=1 Tax=Aldrovandia affinis TaxID=143900 RepID=A0AAD7VVM7_9TELE|nr:hypothetical protein AAFF_G00249470 [Aldrovandia affinis]